MKGAEKQKKGEKQEQEGDEGQEEGQEKERGEEEKEEEKQKVAEQEQADDGGEAKEELDVEKLKIIIVCRALASTERCLLLVLLQQQFIQRPFQVVYSGALPAQPRSNNVVRTKTLKN